MSIFQLVWLMTFVSTVILDVDYGLIVGIGVSAAVVLIRQFRSVSSFASSITQTLVFSRPRSTILGQYDRSETYRNKTDRTRVRNRRRHTGC